MHQIGVVTIGRNEGERLIRCLTSLQANVPTGSPIVYVDSGSTDGSVAKAQAMGINVVELDMTVPFTMARGRNAGFQYLVDNFPELSYVQFIDGDCELLPSWIDRAVMALGQADNLAIVCGRRRERFPDASPYNRLADMEWNTPVGEAKACGGDMLARVEAIKVVGGYNPKMICGEEPEMCIRLRQKGWRVQRIDADMTLHDAAMTRFGQWWKRSIRGGWAVAEGKAMYGESSEAYMVKENKSGWLWGAIIPAVALALAWPTRGLSLLLLLGYLVLGWRIYKYRQGQGDSPAHARIYAFFCTLSKFPQALGQGRYWLNRWRNKPATLIEYKSAPMVSSES
ncbi:glycosyltransferase [Nodosilinea sp. LEGE 06152]|uniref:glycosyltransferase family 2 protein n=1 Tax=Nodosilinea sp. LEGE 06152 TaxID=2777966 RepID=UPI00187FA434|nr:glycosyltransferase [Nodosilinea sp. LEGE 06152]MBE9157535.1 glycosyltransferase [Nodosilinea sp. LEGE 06152]